MSLVLADTSVWIAHFRKPNPILQALLSDDQVICHPMVLIEIACGTLGRGLRALGVATCSADTSGAFRLYNGSAWPFAR
jgi:predicted nucleic acid-binding protein